MTDGGRMCGPQGSFLPVWLLGSVKRKPRFYRLRVINVLFPVIFLLP